jgi:hypothetical protein
MADDFPDVDDVLSETDRPKAIKTPRAKKGRTRRAKKARTKKERPVTKTVERIGQDAFDDEPDEKPKKGKGLWDDLVGNVVGEVKKELKKKGTARQRRTRRQEGKDIATNVGKKLTEIAKTPVGKLVKTGGALAVGTTAALAIIAGTASYYGTTYLLGRLAQSREAKKPAAIKFEAAQAYRQARLDAAAKLGRPLSGPEQKYLADQFKAKLATIR